MVNNKSIKKIFIYIGMICSLCLCCGFFMSEKVSAKNTSVKKVSSTLKNGTFTVSGKGKMPESAMPKAAQKKKIKKIVIKKGVTELPEDAFKNCNKATVITIASTVKSKKDVLCRRLSCRHNTSFCFFGVFGRFYSTICVQPYLSSSLPHWMPVKVSYSFCVSSPISKLLIVTTSSL